MSGIQQVKGPSSGGGISHNNSNNFVPVSLANITGISYLKGNENEDGSVRQIEQGGKFVLQKRMYGLWSNVQSSDQDETVLARSVKTGVGSFHLGDLHNMSSAGENVIFRNNHSNICFFPVWQGISPDGTVLIPPQVRVYGTEVTTMPNGATAASSGSVDTTNTTLYVSNVSVFQASIVAAEAYTGTLRWVTTFVGGIDIIAFSFDVSVNPGDTLMIPFETPLDARAGANVTSNLSKPDGTLFQCRPSTTMPTNIWYSITTRPFSDSNVYHEGNIMTVADVATPLADANAGSAGAHNFFSRGDHVHPREVVPVVQRFTSSGTYTPTAGMRYAIIEGYGAGGAGGTTSTGSIVAVSAAGAGGSGGYTHVMATAAQIGASLALTIGVGGVASATPSTTGPTGGNTVVGSMFTCGGGLGGVPTAAIVGALGASGGLGGVGGTDSTVTGCTFIRGVDGRHGENTIVLSGTILGGRGGDTIIGRGGYPTTSVTATTTTPVNAAGFGAGGSGAAVNGLVGSAKGGNGTPGLVIITEYF